MSQRKRLQRNGSQSARQHLKKASGRERRHVTHVNNVVSKEIVQEAAKRGIKLIALEDLTHIRDHIKAGKRIRSRLHRWSFRELQEMIVFTKRQPLESGVFSWIRAIQARHAHSAGHRANAISTGSDAANVVTLRTAT